MQKSDEALFMLTNADIAPPRENEAEIVLPHMRGGCVTVGNVVHTLFRLPPRRAPAKSGA